MSPNIYFIYFLFLAIDSSFQDSLAFLLICRSDENALSSIPTAFVFCSADRRRGCQEPTRNTVLLSTAEPAFWHQLFTVYSQRIPSHHHHQRQCDGRGPAKQRPDPIRRVDGAVFPLSRLASVQCCAQKHVIRRVCRVPAHSSYTTSNCSS